MTKNWTNRLNSFRLKIVMSLSIRIPSISIKPVTRKVPSRTRPIFILWTWTRRTNSKPVSGRWSTSQFLMASQTIWMTNFANSYRRAPNFSYFDFVGTTRQGQAAKDLPCSGSKAYTRTSTKLSTGAARFPNELFETPRHCGHGLL